MRVAYNTEREMNDEEYLMSNNCIQFLESDTDE